MTLIEMEALDKLIKAVHSMLIQNIVAEQRHFEESCKDLETTVDDMTNDDIREVAARNGQQEHHYLMMLQAEEQLPVLTSLLLYQIATKGSIIKYSDYFSKLENVG